jgi:GH15 family glucan-1,4-alpha-glucosidase
VADRIEDYALLGDLQTAALVSRGGSIDWLCLPRFDSGSCFGALVGTEEHGRWLLAPADRDARSSRRYRGETLILETEWETAGGAVRVVDFMPPRGQDPDVVRIVEGLRGEVTMRSELVIRFDYGHVVPWVRRVESDARLAVAGPDALQFQTPADTRGENMRTVSEVTVREGERVPFVLTWFPSHEKSPASIDPEQALADTEDFWNDWMSECAYDGPFATEVRRSLVVLKALTYAPTGGIVAAATTSLPEQLGGIRNWDYRFCWLRDATLTLLAFLDANYADEAKAWHDWLVRTVAGDPADVQVVYSVMGDRRLPEYELDWLPGYEGSSPVRVGNAACTQIQLDVFGELLDAFYEGQNRGIPSDRFAWALQRTLLGHLAEAWRERDYGLWEVRGEPQHFTHSKVMAWVAFDRGCRSVHEHGLEGPVEQWEALRDEIHSEVCREAWDADLGSFTQFYGSGTLDAALLMIPLVGFLPGDDDRVLGTIAAIERDLVRDGLVLRYRTEEDVDGLPPGEGYFLPCSFWLVEALVVAGRADEARSLFGRLVELANDLDLLAEEYDAEAERLVGNFPQAFTHLALVSAALCLERDGALRGR